MPHKKTPALRSLPKPFVIRDPIHSYIHVAGHERLLIDQPITQRLRHVCQTGTASFVYPAATTSRFAHSLGAMHLASRFLISCLENAARDVADHFFYEIKTNPLLAGYMLTDRDMEQLLGTSGTLSGGGLLASRTTLTQWKSVSDREERRRLLGLVEAALRLAA